MSSNKPPQINPSRALNRQRSEVFLRSQGRQRSDTVLSLKRSVSPMPSRTDKAVEDLSESSELMTRASSNARLSTTMSGIGLRRTASMLELDAAMADQDFAEVRFDDEKLDPDSAAKSSCDGGSFGGLPSIPSVTNMANVSKEVEGADTEPHNDFHVTGGRSTMQVSPSNQSRLKSPTLYQRKLGKTMAGAPPDLSPKAVGNVTTRSVGTETKTRFVNPLDQPKSSSEMVFICRAKNPSKDYALRDVKLSISRTTGEIRLYNMEEKEIGLIFPHKVRKLSSTPATVTFHFKDKKKMLLYTPEGDVIEDRITVILKSLGHYIEVDQKGPSNIIDLPFGLR
ncbi:hypothetical protein SARC_07561 [Sphaeroforma arctica JP610]|uniref:Uncharacterized protein n=1 Tax=Sphaeroforma arctica JP610 TaxID=667725 RepID=A0A0L0FTV6_9EUKA|nr:hypothetical protein SARC_07561 [Sphaeroforma arctica JP610]KNC80074.1 hypothetical protein SARC_07561 [Sphaeroforma arctica JP610]|eukprot:XP_014153976.1 hypothetical protein SARC_07561 [Sphaeroforma arctica JP610]